jgi:Protein kinase domain
MSAEFVAVDPAGQPAVPRKIERVPKCYGVTRGYSPSRFAPHSGIRISRQNPPEADGCGKIAQIHMPLSAGTRLGPYEILSPLGAGGMGEVYRARDPRMGREVAIKLSAEKFSDRFEREVRAVAALNHANICQVYDVGPNYLVMELVEGWSSTGQRLRPGNSAAFYGGGSATSAPWEVGFPSMGSKQCGP